MNEKKWVFNADEYLNQKYIETIKDSDSCDLTLPEYSPPLDGQEAKYFLLGLEEGLFEVDANGYVQSKLLPKPPKNAERQKMIQLFWNFKGGKWRLYREGFCQLATASYLSIYHGWDISQIEMEPDIKNYGNLAYATDILVKHDRGTVAVCCEVKKNDKEFEKLIDAFRHCCARGPHEKHDCEYSRDHSKYEMCEKLRPLYFFATSPGRQLCFNLEYENGIINLHRLESLPQKSEILGGKNV